MKHRGFKKSPKYGSTPRKLQLGLRMERSIFSATGSFQQQAPGDTTFTFMAFFSETCRHAMAQSQSTVKFTQ
jgi:hypothetical protein